MSDDPETFVLFGRRDSLSAHRLREADRRFTICGRSLALKHAATTDAARLCAKCVKGSAPRRRLDPPTRALKTASPEPRR